MIDTKKKEIKTENNDKKMEKIVSSQERIIKDLNIEK